MKKIFFGVFLGIFIFGCSPKVRFESTKPIKIDVTMRVDIYQHIAQQAERIESEVESGRLPQVSGNKPQSRIFSFVAIAYAQEELDPKIKQAIASRKARYPELWDWEAKGVIGENYEGWVEVRKKPQDKTDLEKVEKLVKEENKDRLAIYSSFAQENGISVEEAGTIYSERIKNGAPKGTPIEIEESGKRKWIIKS